MRLLLECWTDGRLEQHTLRQLDRWLVQSAHRLTLADAGGAAALTFHQQPQALSSKKLGVAAVAWDGAFVLAAHLAAGGAASWLGRRVVELGTGVGVVGLLLAAWGAEVTLTDRAPVLPLLQRNCDANRSALGGRVRMRELEWGAVGSLDAAAELAAEGVHCIIAADCLYIDQDGQTPSLTAFLATCHALAGAHTVVLLAFEMRSASLQAAFLSEARARFAEVLPVSQQGLPAGFQAGHVQLYCLRSRLPSLPA